MQYCLTISNKPMNKYYNYPNFTANKRDKLLRNLSKLRMKPGQFGTKAYAPNHYFTYLISVSCIRMNTPCRQEQYCWWCFLLCLHNRYMVTMCGIKSMNNPSEINSGLNYVYI